MLNTTAQRELVTRTQGTGKDLVLLHGWGMNSGVFSEFVPYLSNEFTVTTIDLPGFGENGDIIPKPYDVASITNLIAQVLPSRCVVIGWSLGGLVAQQLALSHPETVSDLVTIAPTPRFVSGPGWPGIASTLLNQFEQQLALDYAKTLDRFLAIQAMGSPTSRQDVKTIRNRIAQLPSPASEALKKALRLLSTEDLRQEVGRIKQPTLRLYGRLDSLIPTSGIDRICELHPNSDTVVLPHAAHAPFISHPQRSADIIRQFVMTKK